MSSSQSFLHRLGLRESMSGIVRAEQREIEHPVARDDVRVHRRTRRGSAAGLEQNAEDLVLLHGRHEQRLDLAIPGLQQMPRGRTTVTFRQILQQLDARGGEDEIVKTIIELNELSKKRTQ